MFGAELDSAEHLQCRTRSMVDNCSSDEDYEPSSDEDGTIQCIDSSLNKRPRNRIERKQAYTSLKPRPRRQSSKPELQIFKECISALERAVNNHCNEQQLKPASSASDSVVDDSQILKFGKYQGHIFFRNSQELYSLLPMGPETIQPKCIYEKIPDILAIM
jgi:hypothetical protein